MNRAVGVILTGALLFGGTACGISRPAPEPTPTLPPCTYIEDEIHDLDDAGVCQGNDESDEGLELDSVKKKKVKAKPAKGKAERAGQARRARRQ